MTSPVSAPRMSRRDILVASGAAGAALLLPRTASARIEQSILPFDPGPQNAAGRRVWAHWHVFPTSFDNKPAASDTYANYMTPDAVDGTMFRDVGGWLRERPLPRPPRRERDWAVLDMVDEIRDASAIGLDGFQFNILSIEPDNRHWINLTNMLEAAKRPRLDFQIMLSIDCVANRTDVPVESFVTALAQIAGHPCVARRADGRVILGAFAAERWPTDRWERLLAGLAAHAQPVFFIPHFLDVSKAPSYLPLIQGASVWGGNHLSQLRNMALFATALRAVGKVWMANVYPQDFRPKDGWFAEAENSRVFRAGWQNALDTGAEMVSISTWDDYSEHSEIKPSTGTQYAFYDLTAFFVEWFKTGKQPGITRDVLYYFHRIESADAPGTGSAQARRFYNHFDEPTLNEIEVVAFLKAPGRVTISTAAGTKGTDADAGITSLRVPLAPGRPKFALLRAGETVISLESAFAIREKSLYQDLLYRGGSSTRPPVAQT